MTDEIPMYELAYPSPRLAGAGERGPVLVHGLGGFGDAGHAVRLAARHLTESLEHEIVASFAVDELLDYRSRRPIIHFDADRFTGYDRPELTLKALRDSSGTPFLLLSGFEPDFRWEKFAEAVRMLVESLGVRRTIGLASFPMGVPHTRPLNVIAHGTNADALEGERRWDGPIRLPASVSMVLERHLAEHGHEVGGYSVQVPHYLSQAEYPEAARRLLDKLADDAGLDLPLAALDAAADEFRSQVDSQAAASDEIRAVIRALEEQYDAAEIERANRELLAGGAPLPSGDELGADFERFLAEQSGRDDEDTEPGD